MTAQQIPTEPAPTELGVMTVSRSRARTSRILMWIALLSIVLGVLWGQAVITWLNATLL